MNRPKTGEVLYCGDIIDIALQSDLYQTNIGYH